MSCRGMLSDSLATRQAGSLSRVGRTPTQHAAATAPSHAQARGAARRRPNASGRAGAHLALLVLGGQRGRQVDRSVAAQIAQDGVPVAVVAPAARADPLWHAARARHALPAALGASLLPSNVWSPVPMLPQAGAASTRCAAGRCAPAPLQAAQARRVLPSGVSTVAAQRSTGARSRGPAAGRRCRNRTRPRSACSRALVTLQTVCKPWRVLHRRVRRLAHTQRHDSLVYSRRASMPMDAACLTTVDELVLHPGCGRGNQGMQPHYARGWHQGAAERSCTGEASGRVIARRLARSGCAPA